MAVQKAQTEWGRCGGTHGGRATRGPGGRDMLWGMVEQGVTERGVAAQTAQSEHGWTWRYKRRARQDKRSLGQCEERRERGWAGRLAIYH